MTTKDEILDMYAHLREANSNISDEALTFMKDTCLAKLEDNTKSYICTDFELIFSDMRMKPRNIKQSPNGNIFYIQIVER